MVPGIHQYGTSALTISSTIANGLGASTLTKAGFGMLVLAGTNTYSGSTTLNGGTLRLGAAAALGTSTLTIANGTTLSMADGIGRTITNAITVGGDFTLGETSVG
ncbi:MAG: hypothetical protein EB140_15645, partial [Proteobacteria bacterium]|nr:hypothetical protein [Pseudomonadota bacterium]